MDAPKHPLCIPATALINEKEPDPPKLPPFMDLMTHSYTFELGIFFSLSVVSLLRLARTCKLLQWKVERNLANRRNINTALSLFLSVDAIPSFRQLQADTGLLVGGTFAQSFINLSTWEDKLVTVDMFVYHEDAAWVSKWFAAHNIELNMPLFSGKTVGQIISRKLSSMRASLTYVPADQDEIRYCGLVLRFSRNPLDSPISHNPEILMTLEFKTTSDIKICLHVCARSALCGIMSLSSTSLMNFVATHSAFSLFPRETFNKKVALSVNATSRNYFLNSQNPFRRWPGQLQDTFYPLNATRDFAAGPRRFSGKDRTCLKVPLLGDGQGLSPYTDKVILESTVYFGYTLAGKGPAFLNFKTWDKYTCTITPTPLSSHGEGNDNANGSSIADGDGRNNSSTDESITDEPSPCVEVEQGIVNPASLEGGDHPVTSFVGTIQRCVIASSIVEEECLPIAACGVDGKSRVIELPDVEGEQSVDVPCDA
ncbi:hypothetical protein ONZ45_g17425 [Pleurotus djamor]|nr:hypothetical protein ONZ45_g17425 [Pleurotus djamor]